MAKKKGPEPEREVPRRAKLFNGSWGVAIVLVLRLAVGGVFIFSGFTKAIDPWGSVYKLTEYFGVYGLPPYDGLLLFLAFALATIEALLGLFVFLGIYRRFAPVAMLLMMVVMLPVTLHMAVTGAVGHCGCFGDAVELGGWATFWKNVALTLGILYLLLYNSRVKNVYSYAVQWIVALISAAYLLTIGIVGYYYQPLIDFRGYPVGSVCDSAVAADGENPGEAFVFVYQKNGLTAEFTLDSLPDSTWVYVDRIAVDSQADSPAPATWHLPIYDKDLNPADEAILTEGGQLWLVFVDFESVWVSQTYLINEICDFAADTGVGVIGLSPATQEEISEWEELAMASYEIYRADGSELKALVRGNPALVYLSDGEIKWKRTLQSLTMSDISSLGSLSEVANDHRADMWLMWLSGAYFALMLSLLILNRTYSLWNWRVKKLRARLPIS